MQNRMTQKQKRNDEIRRETPSHRVTEVHTHMLGRHLKLQLRLEGDKDLNKDAQTVTFDITLN